MAQVKRQNDDIINEKSLFINLKAVALLAQVKVCLENSTQQFNLCIATLRHPKLIAFCRQSDSQRAYLQN